MKKSILSLILAAVLIITNCPVEATGVETTDRTICKKSISTPVVTGYDAKCDLFGQTLNSMMETWLNNALYDKVTVNSSDKEGYYSQITFDISDKNLEYPSSKSTLTQWINQVKNNYPNLCIAGNAYTINSTLKNGHKIIQNCIFNSPISASEIRNTIINYKEKLSSLVNSIPFSLSNSAKLLYLHDQIAGMGDYNGNIANNNFENVNNRIYTPLGVLIDGDGVCQSYAAVMNHAALATGIPSITVTSSNHAWNIVQIDNKWYYIDTTWDDASSTHNTLIGKISHEYFLVDHSTLSANDDSTRPHAIDASFYDIFGSITDSILSSYPNAVPKSESNPYGIGKKMSFLNGSWYYCDNNSIYAWDGKSEYGTKTNAASGIINCCTFENTLYYAKNDGIYQYVDGSNDKKLDDINASNITDMIIVGDTLKYVENDKRKTYSLAKYSTATPTPIVTPTPSPSIAPTVRPTSTANQTTLPSGTQKPAPAASSSAAPIQTKEPNATASPSATPIGTQTPAATSSPSASPSGTQTPAPTASPSASPSRTQNPNATIVPTTSPSRTPEPGNAVTSTTIPSVTQTPNTSKATAAPSKTSKPTTTKKPQVSGYYDDDYDDEEDNIYDEEPEDFEEDDYEDAKSSKKIKKGTTIKDQKTNTIYKITKTGKNKTVEYAKPLKKNATNINIPAKVKLQGKTYKITSVGNGAFKGNKKLTLITLGKNIKKIGTKSFYNCKNLRYLQFKTKKLTSGSIGKKAFGHSYMSPRVKTDKTKWEQYSKILFSKGMSKKAVFIIDPVKLVI